MASTLWLGACTRNDPNELHNLYEDANSYTVLFSARYYTLTAFIFHCHYKKVVWRSRGITVLLLT